jgi:hypothetical protein
LQELSWMISSPTPLSMISTYKATQAFKGPAGQLIIMSFWIKTTSRLMTFNNSHFGKEVYLLHAGLFMPQKANCGWQLVLYLCIPPRASLYSKIFLKSRFDFRVIFQDVAFDALVNDFGVG